LQKVAVVTVADHVDLGDDDLIDLDGNAIGDPLGLLHGEVGLALHIDDLAQGPAIVQVLDHHIFHLIDVADQAGVELGRSDRSKDDADTLQLSVLGVLGGMSGWGPLLRSGYFGRMDRRLGLDRIVGPCVVHLWLIGQRVLFVVQFALSAAP